ncbi:hypothetical protein FQN54_009720 [Arachnomyces sp. PD_36]|nr:hypothetical protein FQN54_009720 [Arachnomyces sp. PD_36]
MANSFNDDRGDTPPRYRIDLSLPPSERYVTLAKRYRQNLRSLTCLFDELVLSIHPKVPLKLIHRLARLFLRQLYTREETQEIQGISKATGISLYFLVALNVVLDLLMGCTSGAAMSKDSSTSDPKMLHFRTLDWGMDSLRQLVVQLDFFRSAESEETVATSITYVGFVGVLTGVRKHLSVSLNFRPNHDSSGFGSNFRYYSGHVLVLLGIRQSISSLLRQYIIPPTQTRGGVFSRIAFWGKALSNSSPLSLSSIATTLPKTPTTAAYLIFSDGLSALTLEKDYTSATIDSSSSFIVATNCDASAGAALNPRSVGEGSSHFGLEMVTGVSVAMADLIEESDERRRCMQTRWDRKVHQAKNLQRRSDNTKPVPRNHRYPTRERFSRNNTRNFRENHQATDTAPSSTASISMSEPAKPDPSRDMDITASMSEIIDWITTYPITNECTHYATVMDPTNGTVTWVKRYLEPMTAELN